MALLDFSRFGVTAQDVKEGKYSYIIGFDLGDGEISAAYWDLKEPIFPRPVDLKFDKDERTKILSGLFEDKDGNLYTVPVSFLSSFQSDQGKLYINFKDTPENLACNKKYENSNITRLELLQKLLRASLGNIAKASLHDKFFIDGKKKKGIIVIGCPSSPEWMGDGNDVSYARMLSDALTDIPLDLTIVIMPESRASLVKVYKEYDFNEKIKSGVIVIDHGSSTLDITVIDLKNNINQEFSIPLGANKIERAMRSVALMSQGKTPSELKDPDFHLLSLRVAKEAYFSYPLGKIPCFFEYKNGDYTLLKVNPEFMYKVTNEFVTSYSTTSTGTVKGTWADLHKQFLRDCIGKCDSSFSNNNFKGVIILTGGASKMQFIEDNIKYLFPDATVLNESSKHNNISSAVIYKDPEPSYCVSRGLAWAAYSDLKALKLIDDVKEQINTAIISDYSTLKSIMAKKLAPLVYEYSVDQLAEWVENGDNITSRELVSKVEKSFLDKSTTDGLKRVDSIQNRIKEAIAEYLNNNEKSGVRAKIVDTVNKVFSKAFPGKIEAKNIPTFTINDNDWAQVISEATSNQMNFQGTILEALDLENVLGAMLKFVIALAIIIVAFALQILTLGIIDAETIMNRFSWLFNENRRLSKDQRKKAYQKLKEKRSETITKIEEGLNKAQTSASAQEVISSQIVETLSPAIDKAVNVVSIYF